MGLAEPSVTTKMVTNMTALLLGTKVTMDDFSFRARFLLGDLTLLLGTEDEPVEYNTLSLVDRFEVIYQLISIIEYNDAFRKQVDKYDRAIELRFDPIFDDGETSYFLLSDNRVYKRTLVSIPEIKIPKKYKYAKMLNPEVDFEDIEPKFEWECVAIGIYQLHDFLESIKNNSHLKPLFKNIKEHIDDLANEDLNNRKKILKRKREQQLNELVSHRKRSSRLQEKEEQMLIEKQKKQEEEARQQEALAKAKLLKRYKQKVKLLEHEAEERLRRQTTSRRAALLEEYKPSSNEEIELEEGDWLFDCYCGTRQKNYDDGVKLIKCERCNRWQHLKCQDRAVRQDLVKNSDEVFICLWCREEIELQVAKKLEEEKLQKEKEAAEKARQRELQKQKLIEERLRLEEEEKKRKEELERERERRSQERSRASTTPADYGSRSVTPQREDSVELLSQVAFSTQKSEVPTPVVNQPPSILHNGPTMGTFQTSPPQYHHSSTDSLQGLPNHQSPSQFFPSQPQGPIQGSPARVQQQQQQQPQFQPPEQQQPQQIQQQHFHQPPSHFSPIQLQHGAPQSQVLLPPINHGENHQPSETKGPANPPQQQPSAVNGPPPSQQQPNSQTTNGSGNGLSLEKILH